MAIRAEEYIYMNRPLQQNLNVELCWLVVMLH